MDIELYAKQFEHPLVLPGTVLLITGQSGSGKNMICKRLQTFMFTQSDKFKRKEHLFYSKNGDGFRAYAKDLSKEAEKPVSRLCQVIQWRLERYRRQNSMLPLLFLLTKIQYEYTENDLVLVNGSPRTKDEFKAWLSFVGTNEEPNLFTRLVVVNLEISDTTSKKRLVYRNREDSNTQAKIRKKIAPYSDTRTLLNSIVRNTRNKTIPRKLVKYVSLIKVDAEKNKDETFREFIDELYKLMKNEK